MSSSAIPKLEIPAGLGVAIGVAVVGALVLLWAKAQIQEHGGLGVGEYLGKTAGDAAAGLVVGVGDSLGIPRTDETECDRAIREGRTWDASFACPAARFIREGLFGSAEPNKPASSSLPGYTGVW